MKTKHIVIALFLLLTTKLFSQEYLTISGVITNVQNGNALNDIDVVVKDQLTGTISNNKGAYILYLNQGSYELYFSAKGYKTEQIKVELTENLVQMVELTPKNNFTSSTKKLNRKVFPLRSKGNDVLSANHSPKSDTLIK